MGVGIGIFTLLPFLISLFVIVLMVVFIFKVISFMNQKTEADRQRNETLKEILNHLKGNDKD